MQYEIHVAEICRVDGTIDGGFIIDCYSEDELEEALYELEDEIADEELTDIYPFHSLRWQIVEV